MFLFIVLEVVGVLFLFFICISYSLGKGFRWFKVEGFCSFVGFMLVFWSFCVKVVGGNRVGVLVLA